MDPGIYLLIQVSANSVDGMRPHEALCLITG